MKRTHDNKGIVMSPSVAAYQQLFQLQSQQPYVPISCEYPITSISSASADTLYPIQPTNTSSKNANNLHTLNHENRFNYYKNNNYYYNKSQTSSYNDATQINHNSDACNLSSNNNMNIIQTQNYYTAPITTTTTTTTTPSSSLVETSNEDTNIIINHNNHLKDRKNNFEHTATLINMSDNIINNLIDDGNISSNDVYNNSTFFALADARPHFNQSTTRTAHQNSISQSSTSSATTSPSKVTQSSNNLESKLAVATNAAVDASSTLTSSDDGDSENVLNVQNAKVIVASLSNDDDGVDDENGNNVIVSNENNNNNNCNNNTADEIRKSINDLSTPIVVNGNSNNSNNITGVESLPEAMVSSTGNVTCLVDESKISSSSTPSSALPSSSSTSSSSSIQQSTTTIDESNLNANSFNSAIISSSQGAVATSQSAIYTTSSIINNNINNNNNSNNNINNHSIFPSRKSSLTSTPNQHLAYSQNNSSKAQPMMASYTTNTLNGGGNKVDHVPDYLSASSQFSNHPQAAFFHAMLYQQQQQQPAAAYQQLAFAQNLYSADPAQLAKDFAQKNYANALKFAVAQQQQQQHQTSQLSSLQSHQQQTGVPVSASSVVGGGGAQKAQLTAMPFSGMTLTAGNNAAAAAMYGVQQPASSAMRLQSQITQAGRSPYLSQLTRPMQTPYQQFIRPQMPVNIQAAAANNPYYAAAAHQQYLSHQQNLLYSGLTSSMATPQLTAAAAASTPTSASSLPTPYSYALSQAQAQGLSASMMQVPQITPTQTSQTSATSVLNPYKKMKTS